MLFFVINESKGADAAGFESQIAHHAFGTGKREFAGRVLTRCQQGSFEPLLQIVDSQVMIAVKADEVMLRALVVAHEDILAMHAAIVLPPAFSLLDGLALGVVVARVWYVMRSQVIQHLFLSFHVCVKMF